jgi:hypothetical protein
LRNRRRKEEKKGEQQAEVADYDCDSVKTDTRYTVQVTCFPNRTPSCRCHKGTARTSNGQDGTAFMKDATVRHVFTNSVAQCAIRGSNTDVSTSGQLAFGSRFRISTVDNMAASSNGSSSLQRHAHMCRMSTRISSTDLASVLCA